MAAGVRRTPGELLPVSGLLLLETDAGAGLDLGLRLIHGELLILPTLDLVGQVDAVGTLCLIDALGQRQKLLHFGPELVDMDTGQRTVT